MAKTPYSVGGKSPYSVGGFDEFRQRAADPNLSVYEKIGVPNDYRSGRNDDIIADFKAKLPALGQSGAKILDIGAGCTELPIMLADICGRLGGQIVLVDSEEMLGHLPHHAAAVKVGGAFPDCADRIAAVSPGYDAIIVYSVLQYVFVEGNLWRFVDAAAGLLNEGGRLLLGDLPNASKRRRFLSSNAGRAYHKKHYDPNTEPAVTFNRLDVDEMDDGVILGLLQRLRAGGFDAYVVPQSPALSMANRREDILICRP